MKRKHFLQKRGFTLVELLVVISIITILFVVLISKVDFSSNKARKVGAQTDLRSYQIAIQTVARERQEIPTELDQLKYSLNKNLDAELAVLANSDYLSGAKDPWGSEYRLTPTLPPETKGSVLIQSFGPDKTPNTDDDLKISITYELTEFGGRIVVETEGAAVCNHEFGDWIVVSVQSCDTVGEKYRTCAKCGYEEIVIEPKLGHTPNSNGICTACSEDVRAGLYATETDQMLLSWKQLRDQGIIKLVNNYDGTYEVLQKDELAGDLVLPRHVVRIESSTFAECKLLTGIEIPKQCNSIYDRAFMNCTSLASVKFETGSQLSMVGSYAFYGCTSLEEISIPNTVNTINFSAFENCSSLSSVHINTDSHLQTINPSAFEGCSALTSIYIPEKVTSIGMGAFRECGLQTIHIPKGVAALNNETFENCTALISVTMEDNISLTKVGDSCFEGCTSLLSISLPDSLTTIGNNAFRNCKSLTHVNIPPNVTFIGEAAFIYCKNISNEITIPIGVTVLKGFIFMYCEKIPNIVVHDNVTSFGPELFDGCKSIQYINIPEGISTIPFACFRDCVSLTDVNLPSTLTSVEDDAFKGCYFDNVMIPDGVTFLGSRSFDCNFKSIIIPTSIISCGTVPFGYNDTKEIYYGGDISQWFKFIGLNTIYPAYVGSSSPDTGANLYLTNASGKYELLTDLIVPADITEIPACAFYGIGSLQSVYMHDNVVAVKSNAFYGCASLHTVRIPNNCALGLHAFNCSDNLVNIEYGPSGIDFSTHVITTDKSKNLYFRGTLSEYLNNTVFIGSFALNELYLYDTDLDEFVLVTDLVIPSDITDIPSYAFRGCDTITSIVIGEQVTSIGKYAFNSCVSLETVTIYATTPPTFNTESFLKNHMDIYVPAESVDAYKTADGWSDFASMIQAIPIT